MVLEHREDIFIVSQLRVVGVISAEGAYRVACRVFFYRTVIEFSILFTLDTVTREGFDAERCSRHVLIGYRDVVLDEL